MSTDEINHALAALDNLRVLIKHGEVVAWAYCSVNKDSLGPQGFVADRYPDKLYTAIGLLTRRYEDELLANLKPKVT